MTGKILISVISLINLISVIVVLITQKRRGRELERRIGLIEHYVLRLEKRIKKNLADNTDTTFLISKGLLELIDEKKHLGDIND